MRLAGAASAFSIFLITSSAALAGPDWGSPTWTGVYFGGFAGIDRNNVDWDSDTGIGLDQFAHLGSTNVNAGLFSGYNYEFASRGVAGLEIGADFLTSKAFETAKSDPVLTDNFVFTAGPRIGGLVTPRTLLYGRLSYAGIRASAPEERWAASAKNGWLNGYQAAVGVESEVSPSFRLRAEIAFTQAVDSLHLELPLNDFKPQFFGVRLGAIYSFDKPRQGGSTEEMVTADVGSWTGLYIGVHGGAAAGGTVIGHFDTDTEGPYSDIEANWGGWAGYDLQVSPSWVVGAEADYTSLGLANRRAGDTVDFAKIDWMAAATLRSGYLIDPATLIYVKGGWAAIHTEGTPEVFLQDAASGDVNAGQVGLGVEVKLNRHVSLRAEGLYTTALDNLWFNRSTPPFTVPKADYLSPTLITGQVGAAMRF